MEFIDIFSDDAFSMGSLTDALSNVDHVPQQAGIDTFAGAGTGIRTTKVFIESRDRELNIISTSARGGPAPQEVQDKARLIEIVVPHIQLEETISAASVQDRRAFGTSDLVGAAQDVVNDQLQKIGMRFDLTMEHLRVGALQGKLYDADGSLIADLFDVFDVPEAATVELSSSAGTLRDKLIDMRRSMERSVKLPLPPTARVKCLASATFFDSLVGHADVQTTFQNWEGARAALGGDNRSGFEFAGITFEEYRATDTVIPGEVPSSEVDQLIGKVGITDGQAIFFFVGVPGLYSEKFSPADFWDTINAPGLPRYARIAMDDNLNRWVKLHVQSNPLPLCLRPATLRRASF